MKLLFAVFAVVLSVAVARGQSAATLNIQVNQPGAVVSSNLFGIFFEEINSAGDGGLYGELVRNRSFEDATNSPVFWSLVTNGTATGQMLLDTSSPMSVSNLYSLALTKSSGVGSMGAANNGYWGIPLTNGATYKLEFYARGAAGFSGAVSVSLESSNGNTVYAQTNFTGLTTSWQHFTGALLSSGTDTNAQLVLRISQTGTVYLDFVSLFPANTFHNRTNGLRPDLANMLVNLNPAFMRFPGGSWVDGLDLSDAYHWQPTVGFLPDRTVRTNIWGYMVDNGLGYHEYLQLCEDLGTEPLFDVNAGISGGSSIAPANLGPWIQEALNAIQYANGDTSTTYGAMRAANGHPAPFNLKYIEIGNENGGSAYNSNYALFYDAIKSNYPAMHMIANNWGGIPSSRPVEIEDEHYYASASTFMGYATKYDSYSRSGPKVFVGEYAVAYNIGPGFLATLNNALGEAAFMTGIERNSDIVSMACYAPLFANWNNQDWTPNLIYFNGTQVYGTPSYYVQQMFANNHGDTVLPMTISLTPNGVVPPPHGAIGLGSWNTSVQYTNVTVTSNGVVLYQSDFTANGTNGWRVYNGTWSTNAGLYQQTSSSTTDCRSTTGSTGWANYTLSLRARKTSGSEGFLIMFDWADDNNWTWWNVGGWGNTKDGIEQMVGGNKTTLGQVSQTALANNTWYDISIVVSNYTMQCYLNGALVQTVNYSASSTPTLYASATYNKSANQVIVKAVNPGALPVVTTLNLAGVSSISPNVTVSQLTSGSVSDLNSFASPTLVSPVTNLISNAGTNFNLTLAANSVSVIRLSASGINNYTNLTLQLPSVITNGVAVASSVWAQQSGNWINLTTNSNHAITWSSDNTSVAVVDSTGNVTGVAIGTANIIVSYPALGLSATQSVRVVYVPATLVHRYSFGETSGSTVADSVGGAAWNGTLPNGGTFSSGQLQLTASSSQYVQLPAGILSNYTAVTIEAWASFPGTLPGSCFLFGFGNISGNTGYNYIFCQPKDGRIAITPSNYSGEQNTSPSPSSNWSGQSNLHVTAVFNPPQGYLTLYTNGVLVAANYSVTTSLSSVNDLFSYIGRSLYSGDSYMNLNLDEFRIYSGALSASAISAADALGANQLLPASLPDVPAGVTATAGSTSVVLNWSAATNASSYNVKRSLTDGGSYSVMATNIGGLTWTDLGLTNGTMYFYVVSANNVLGESADSGQVNARPVSSTLPQVNFSISGSQFRLNWPADHTGWRLQMSTNLVVGSWLDVSGTSGSNSILISATNRNAFFRLTYP